MTVIGSLLLACSAGCRETTSDLALVADLGDAPDVTAELDGSDDDGVDATTDCVSDAAEIAEDTTSDAISDVPPEIDSDGTPDAPADSATDTGSDDRPADALPDGESSPDAEVADLPDVATEVGPGPCAVDDTPCGDGNPCTIDSCDPATGCVNDAVAANGHACTAADKCKTVGSGVCSAGTCTGGTAKDCSGLDDDCNHGACDATTGACMAVAWLDGMACKDADYCTIGDECQAGKCLPGQPKKCGANATCAGGACNCNPGYEKKGGVCELPPCPPETTQVYVDGATVCAPEYPAWGIRPESPPAEWFVDNGDGTVNDTQSGLLWQKEYAPQPMTWWDAYAYCDGLELGGRTDWRLPSRAELLTLVDYTKDEPATPDVFGPALSFFWTVTPLHGYASWMVWVVGMYAGVAYYDVLGDPNATRCIQSSGASGKPARYEVDAEVGTVKDLATGLTWERDGAASGKKDWNEASQYCATLQTAGSGWRLPTVVELISITDVKRHEPAIDESVFGPTPIDDHTWSSTPAFGVPGWWMVDFELGFAGFGGTEAHRARCVR
jgi:hypothetical protein